MFESYSLSEVRYEEQNISAPHSALIPDNAKQFLR